MVQWLGISLVMQGQQFWDVVETWFLTMQKPKGSLSFSCSLSVPYGTLHYSFLFYLTSTTKSLSHFLSPHSSRNEFLDIIPKLCTHHCQAWCCVRQNRQMIRILKYQEDRAKDLGFFCCPVFSPHFYAQKSENFCAWWSQSLEAYPIFHSAQLQFPQGFPFLCSHPLHSSPWRPPHCSGQPIRMATMQNSK